MILPKGIKMQFKNISFFVILSIIFLLTGCDSKDPEAIKNAIAKEQEPTVIELKTNNDQLINATISKNKIIFSGQENKVVLLNFFATWCPPCKAEIPHLNRLKERYKEQFEVIGVLVEKSKTKEEVNAFIEEYEIQFPVTNHTTNFTLADAVGGVKSIPTMLLFDKNGTLIRKYIGIVPEEMLEIDIKKGLEAE